MVCLRHIDDRLDAQVTKAEVPGVEVRGRASDVGVAYSGVLCDTKILALARSYRW
jgi:hypothetical protein